MEAFLGVKDGAVLVPSCLQARMGWGTKGQAMGSRRHREVAPYSQRARPQAGVQVSSGPANPAQDDGTVDGNCPAFAVRTDEQLALPFIPTETASPSPRHRVA